MLPAGLFPEWVAVALATEADLAHEAAWPDEMASLSAAAIEARRRDFSLGRIAARRALRALNTSDAPLLVGTGGAPQWPAGVVGSLSHAGGIAAAAVAPAARCAGLGLDMECLRPLQEDIAEIVADDAERAWVAGDERRLLQLFSAKEAVYKALYSHHRAFFGFEAVTLTPSDEGFIATLLQPLGAHWPGGHRLEIRSRIEGERVWSALLLPSIT